MSLKRLISIPPLALLVVLLWCWVSWVSAATVNRQATDAENKISGEVTSDYFGSTMAVGDLNNDGYEDVAVGAYRYDNYRGRVYIFLSDGSIPALASNADYIISTTVANYYWGESLAIGDLNNDGKDDLVIGHPYYGNGYTHIFYQDSTLWGTVACTTDCQASNADVIIEGETAVGSSMFGSSFAIGDLNGDTKNDLAVGSIYYNSSQGRAYVFYQDSTLWGTSTCTTGCLAANADVKFTGESGTTYFGSRLAIADLNADGRSDLAVSAYMWSSASGRVYVFYRPSGGFASTIDATSANATISGNQHFGISLQALDMNSDNKPDLVASAEHYMSDQGRVYIYYNDGSYPSAMDSADVIITGESGTSRFGMSMTKADMNLDGKADLIVGGDKYNSNQGRAYVFYADGTYPSGASGADEIYTGESTEAAFFGNAVAVGKINSDSKPDLVVGAYALNGTSAGHAYIFYNFNTVGSLTPSASITNIAPSFKGGPAEKWDDTSNNPFWDAQNSGTAFQAHSALFINRDIGWMSATGGIIRATTNGGDTWSVQTSGVAYNLEDIDFADINTGWMVGSGDTIITTSNGGSSWSSQTSGTSGVGFSGIKFVNSSTGWAVGSNGTIIKTVNGGTNWGGQTSGVSLNLEDVDFIDANNGWVVGEDGTIVATTNGGTNWSPQTSPVAQYLYDVDFVSSTVGWAVGHSGSIIKTTNGGSNWTAQTSGVSVTLNDISCLDTNTCWVFGHDGTILYTSNGGSNWTSQSYNTTNALRGGHAVDSLSVWAVGDNGFVLKGGLETESSSDQPTNAGSNVTFTATATDPNVEQWYLAICKDNAVTPGDDAAPTCNQGWGTAGLIETDDSGTAWNPQIASDPSGNMIAVWHQADGWYNIYANRYVAGSGWSGRELIEASGAGNAFSPQIASDPSGNMIAVWYQSDGTRNNVYANRYTPSGGWAGRELIEADDAGGAQTPQIASDSSGNMVAVWYQSDGTRDNIWANRYTAGIGWGAAQLIETNSSVDAQKPQIASDSSGNMMAVWEQSDGVLRHIWANRYTYGVGWGTAGLIEDITWDAEAPQIASDPSGNMIAVWVQYDSIQYNIYANRYVVGSGWGTAGPIEVDDAGVAQKPQIASDSSGNMVAVWQQSDGTHFNIYTNRYTPSGGWAGRVLIETGDTDAYIPRVSVDPSGNAIAVWYQPSGGYDSIWANRYTVGGVWGAAGLIETDNAGAASLPQIASDPAGNMAAVWYQTDGIRNNIWANRYSAGSWAVSTSSVASGAEQSVTYTTSAGNAENNVWYAFACDKAPTGAYSASSQGSGDSGSPFAVNHRPAIGTVAIGPTCGSSVSIDPGNSRSAKIITPIGSVNEMGQAIAIQTDGKAVLGGYSNNGTNDDFAIARYHADGTLDTTFDTDGKKTISLGSGNDRINSVVIQSDGKILAAGYGMGGLNYEFALARFNTDGSPDTTFDTDGQVMTDIASGGDYASGVVIQSDGKIIAAGYSDNAGNLYDFTVVRYNSDGSLDTSFDTDGKIMIPIGTSNDFARGMALQSDGKIVIVGDSSNGTDYDIALTRLNVDGSLDSSFGTSGKLTFSFGISDENGFDVLLQSDGKIVVAGSAFIGSTDDLALARLNSNGSFDTSFSGDGKVTTDIGTNSYDIGYSAVLESGGKIVFAGASANQFTIVRYLSDGTLDTSFDTDGKVTTTIGIDDSASGVALQTDGKIVAAGRTSAGSNYDFALVRYKTDGSLDDLTGYACVQTGVTDSDTSNTVDVHVCSTNSFTGSACSATTYCFITGVKTGQSAQCVANGRVPIPTAHNASVPVYVFLKDSHGLVDAGTSNTQTYSVTNTPPYISSSNDYMVNDIILTPKDSTVKAYLATIKDDNGDTELTGTTAVLYDKFDVATNPSGITLSSGTCTSDDLNCYPGISCSPDATDNDNSLVYTCNPAIWFNANASDNWRLHANPTDGTNSPTTLTDSNMIQVEDLQAINIPQTEIAYGALALGQISSGMPITIENAGNQTIDVLVQGTAMTGPGSPIVPAQQHWHNTIENFTYASGNVLVVDASGATTKAGGCADRDIAVRNDHASGSWSDETMYWKLQIPSIQTAGSYTGTNTFVAANQNQCSDGEVGQDVKVTVTFDSDNSANAMAFQSDEKVVLAGYSTPITQDFSVARLTGDFIPVLDTTFGTGGKVTTSVSSTGVDQARSVAVQSDGKIVAAGYGFVGSYQDFVLIRYNTDGSLDTDFGGDGVVTTAIGDSYDYAMSVEIQSDGKILAAGYSFDGSSYNFALVRYNSNGGLDSSFGVGGKVTTDINAGHDYAYDVAVQSDGKIVIAGYAAMTTNDFAVVRYTSSGALDTTFSGDGILTTPIGSANDMAYVVAIQSNGKIVVGGMSNNGTNDDYTVVRYNTDGSLDSTFSSDGIVVTDLASSVDVLTALALQSDGKIVVAGGSDSGTTEDFAVVRYNTDGTLDTSFNTDGIATAAIGTGQDRGKSVVVLPNGKIVVGGYSYNGIYNDFAMVRFTPDGVVDN